MADPRFIEIPLPEGARPSPFDLELLKAALHAIVNHHFSVGEDSAKAVRDLEGRGWHVHLGPTWLATGRRERASEQALGRTPDEAVAKLYAQLRCETYEAP